jgi:hypothetical protein
MRALQSLLYTLHSPLRVNGKIVKLYLDILYGLDKAGLDHSLEQIVLTTLDIDLH